MGAFAHLADQARVKTKKASQLEALLVFLLLCGEAPEEGLEPPTR